MADPLILDVTGNTPPLNALDVEGGSSGGGGTVTSLTFGQALPAITTPAEIPVGYTLNMGGSHAAFDGATTTVRATRYDGDNSAVAFHLAAYALGDPDWTAISDPDIDAGAFPYITGVHFIAGWWFVVHQGPTTGSGVIRATSNLQNWRTVYSRTDAGCAINGAAHDDGTFIFLLDSGSDASLTRLLQWTPAAGPSLIDLPEYDDSAVPVTGAWPINSRMAAGDNGIFWISRGMTAASEYTYQIHELIKQGSGYALQFVVERSFTSEFGYPNDLLLSQAVDQPLYIADRDNDLLHVREGGQWRDEGLPFVAGQDTVMVMVGDQAVIMRDAYAASAPFATSIAKADATPTQVSAPEAFGILGFGVTQPYRNTAIAYLPGSEQHALLSLDAFDPSRDSALMVDGAVGSAEALPISMVLVQSAATATDQFEAIGMAFIEGVAVATDVVSHSATSELDASSTGIGKRAGFSVSDSITAESIATATDGVTTDSTSSIHVSASAADQTSIVGTGSQALSVVASASDKAFIVTTTDITSLAAGSDGVSSFDGFDLAEVALASGIAEPAAASDMPDILTVSAHAFVSLHSNTTSTTTLQAAAIAVDELFAKDDAVGAITLNPEVGAVAAYVNWPITGMASDGCYVYAVGPEGLYVVGGNSDEGEAIDASINMAGISLQRVNQYGQAASTAEKKRIEAVWIDGRSDTSLAVDITSYDQMLATFTYNSLRPIEQHGNIKIPTGKGLRSRWYGLTLRNTQGGDFAVTGISADVIETDRRR